MRLDFPPKYTEVIGAVKIHSLQKVYEIDSGYGTKTKNSQLNNSTISFGNKKISKICNEMAIVIPVKNEKLSLLEGVLSGVPNECLIIIVSNSQKTPVDRYSMEVEMVKQYSQFTNKRIAIVHQRDSNLGRIFHKLNYSSILDNYSQIRSGKAEGMVIGILLAKMHGMKYVGFVDSDNYFPGAVNEYVKIFASGFAMSKSHLSNVRVCWRSKPKVANNRVYFPRWGRISEHSNKYLNDLISYITGFERDIVTTGNAGEHALSMSLAENMDFSTGYSVEPYELINILEKFGGIINETTNSTKGFVEVFQIETRNPHFHENKGDEHITGMLYESLNVINNSKICNTEITKDIKNHMIMLQHKANDGSIKLNGNNNDHIMAPINTIPIDKFNELVIDSPQLLHLFNV
ncbi:MAG: mannosyl-3-phosphoglycerate synthase [Candidatus Nitrosocosmicus sp.]|jgi:mannosyl-3-phosphoglycerate synthase|nr:mannosyl-3-phosphoglycerate synthase [Candidatus Nitrosocosmicus sp.]